jgi:hypothetical protein
MPLTKSQVSKLDPSNLQPEIKKLQLPQISQKHILHKKADIEDFKACQDSPTVLPQFLELYVKFQQKYGHRDQDSCVQSMRPAS